MIQNFEKKVFDFTRASMAFGGSRRLTKDASLILLDLVIIISRWWFLTSIPKQAVFLSKRKYNNSQPSFS